MFSGIVQAVGSIAEIDERGGDRRLTIAAGALDLTGAKIGDSIAVAGVCLTVTELDGRRFIADVSRETLAATTLGAAAAGISVNLEKALTFGAPVGGHLLTGHVDGVGRLLERCGEARSVRMRFELPALLARYVARKGAIAIDGVSLTVNGVDGVRFDVNLVPHTLEHTTLADLRTAAAVNVEIDLVARYLERLTSTSDSARSG